MYPQFQFPISNHSPSAASAVPECQIHYGVPTNNCLPPGEDIAERRETLSDDGPQGDFLLEGPYFSGYHAQIADNARHGSVPPHDGMLSPVAASVNGAGGNFPLTYPNPWGEYPKDRFSAGDGNIALNTLL